jgi:hypothetical protein
MRVLPVVLIALAVLFSTGLVAPRKSRRLESWINDRLERGEDESQERAGFIGDWTAKALCWGQRLVDAAAGAGRSVRGFFS